MDLPPMLPLLPNITRHEHSILFALVLAEALGLPVPAALALLMAGGAAKNVSQLCLAILISLSAMLLGDVSMFLIGRRTGWWLLGVLCKVSVNPDSCILSSAESFVRRGRLMLVLAKFVPGINTLSPPLAGSMNMHFVNFFALDLAGASLYIFCYCGLGWLFKDSLALLTNNFHELGRIVTWILALAMALYFGNRLRLFLAARAQSYVPRVSAPEIARRLELDLPHDMALFDVRSHGYYSKGAARIIGSLRLEPNTLLAKIESLPKDKEIILYCSCHSEGTSVRVARILLQHGCRTSIIKGGLRAWKKGGFPMEAVPADDIVLMPTF